MLVSSLDGDGLDTEVSGRCIHTTSSARPRCAGGVDRGLEERQGSTSPAIHFITGKRSPKLNEHKQLTGLQLGGLQYSALDWS